MPSFQRFYASGTDLLVTAMIGGYAGAAFARRLPAVWLRRLVVTVGSALTVIYFFKTYL